MNDQTSCRYWILLSLMLCLLISCQGWAQWTAYNDCLKEPGDTTGANVTSWTIHEGDRDHATGSLRNIQNGSEAGMPQVTFTMGPAGLGTSSGGSGGNPAPGTDAYAVFDGFVDFGPNLPDYGSSGWWAEIAFSGLDPGKTYTFVGTAIRGKNYPARVSLFTISDALSAVNTSSPGVLATTDNTTRLLAGDNRSTGYVVRWENIQPAAQGTFKIRAEAAPGSQDGKAYPFGGFMLQEEGEPGNLAPEVDAGDNDALTWPVRTLQLNPIVEDDDFSGSGELTFAWRQLSGPGDVQFSPDAATEAPVARFPGPGEFELELLVRDDEALEGRATVTITILEPLWGDLNGDARVNWRDLQIFSAQWLDGPESLADFDGSGLVDMPDLAILLVNWDFPAPSPLVINEVLARNDLTNPDPQGDYEDWIEIYNASEELVNVAGMYLTDDPSEPTKWRFPLTSVWLTIIPPQGHLLVWADNDPPNSNALHAAFEIDASQDHQISLFDSDGHTLIDTVYLEGQTPDVSFGRVPDGSDTLSTLTPTPGSSNDQARLSVVADTKFSHDRGFYNEPFDLAISTETEDVLIIYTLDGSTPSTGNGQVYDSPIRIAKTTCVRAMAFRLGWKSTNVDTHSYFFLDDVIQQATHPSSGAQVAPPGYPTSWGGATGDYQMDPDVIGQNGRDDFGGKYARTIRGDLLSVPTVSLVMDPADWFGNRGIYINKSQDGTERVCSFEYLDPNTGDQIQVNTAMAMQGGVSGGGTSLNRWKSYKLSMRPRFKVRIDNGTPTGGPSKAKFRFFSDSPVERYNSIVLDAVLNHAWLHPSSGQRNTARYIQDQIVADLHNDMGGQSPHGAYAHVYINGLYWGMYYIHERPDHAWAAQIFGGDEDAYDAIKHRSSGVINNGLGGSATANYNAMLAAVSAVRSDPRNLTKYNALLGHLDVDNFITYSLTNWYCGNHDWPHKNWYATHHNVPGGQWRFHSWDAEHALEGGNDVGESPQGIHDSLVRSDEYRISFADHIYRHFFNNGALSYPATAQRYQMRMDQVERAIVGESARWGDNRQSKPYTRDNWLATQNNMLQSFFPGRSNQVLSSLRNANLYPNVDPPMLAINGQAQLGGHVPQSALLGLSNTGTYVFYSLNGADPRLPGGTINQDEVTRYTSSIVLDHSVHVRARTYHNSTWSALQEAVFAVGPVAENLRITEIMYHPEDPNAEFIELQNVGADAINLNLVHFTNGVVFEFPEMELAPHGYVVLVRDRDSFQSLYGLAPLIAGQFAGHLDNAGERIALADAAGQIIHDFRFRDNWYDSTDGAGFSLVVKDPVHTAAEQWGDKAVWRPSAYRAGSPGADDTGLVPELGSVVINEIMAHSHAGAPDWIELHNTTDEPLDISMWLLSDDQAHPGKYQIPAGTILDPQGYVVFYEDLHFGNPATLGGDTPFALSENGETLHLHSSSNGQLTGYQVQETFGASATGVSLGRYRKSTGTYNFVALSQNTPGAENAYPLVGPIVINEIMYHHAVDADVEYVELLNISDQAVALYNPAPRVQMPWRFTDDPIGIEFLWPSQPEVVMQPGELILLVKNSARVDLHYDIPGHVLVFAWDEGRLANDRDKIQLSQPGDVDINGQRQWIRIDRVVYSDGAHHDDFALGLDPWPVDADGLGQSLHRTIPEGYGNDPDNWEAAPPSPGQL